MKKILPVFLAITIVLAINSITLAETPTSDVKITRLEAQESTGPQGAPSIHVMALINNSGLAVDNCEVVFKINGTEKSKDTYIKIDVGYDYLFSGVFEAPNSAGQNSLELNVCPTAPSEKNKNNNSRKITIQVNKETRLQNGSNVDLTLSDYKTLSVRDKTNTDKYWFLVKYQNAKENAAAAFSIRYTVNNLKEGSIQAPILPGRSTAVYSAFFTEAPYVEGENLTRIILDPDQAVPESNEKNTYYYRVTVMDGAVAQVSRLSKDQNFLVDGLLFVPQQALTAEIQAQMQAAGSGVVTIPMLNVGNDLIAASTPLKLKIILKQGGVSYQQIYDITSWPKGTKKTFYFTSHTYKKKELAKNFQAVISLEGKEIHNKNYKVSCF